MSVDRAAWSRRAMNALVWMGVMGALAKAALALDGLMPPEVPSEHAGPEADRQVDH